MESLTIYVLDTTDFHTIDTIFQFLSLVWVERYNDPGEFILRCPYRYDYYELLQPKRYISIDESDRLMIIENVELGAGESIPYIEVSGRSYEEVLNYRFVHIWWPHAYLGKDGNWKRVTLPGTRSNQTIPGHWEIHGNIQDGILYIMTGVFTEDDYPWKLYSDAAPSTDWGEPGGVRIPHFHIRRSTNPIVREKTGNWNGAYDYFGDLISQICKRHDLGYRIVYDKESDVFFELYSGADRTEDGSVSRALMKAVGIPVIFSEEYNNLISSKLYKTTANFKNGYYTINESRRQAAEDYESDKPHWWINAGWPNVGVLTRMGLVFVEGADPTDKAFLNPPESSTPEENEDFNQRVQEAINNFLYEHREETVFEAEVIPDGYFRYGKDYFLGDLVTIRTTYGVRANARVSEITRSWDVEGHKISPVFSIENFETFDPDAVIRPENI